MASAETYVRFRTKSAEEFGEEIDVDEFQRWLATIPGYIGSYEVDVEGLNASTAFLFNVVAGFRPPVDEPGNEEQMNDAIATLLEQLSDDRVAERRTLRRRD
jgi:hypothetical protein